MKSSTQDQVESKIHKVKGEIKEIAGKLSKNTDLERRQRRKDSRRSSRKDRPDQKGLWEVGGRLHSIEACGLKYLFFHNFRYRIPIF